MQWLPALRSRVVSRLPDGVARRRPGDAARVAVAIGVLAAASVHAFHPTQVERDVAEWAQDLPAGAFDALRFLYELLSLWAIGIVVTALVFLRRWRLARDLAAAALVAWCWAAVSRSSCTSPTSPMRSG